MAETLKDKLKDELYKAGLDEIYDAVHKLKDDEDVRNYMWANRGYFDKRYNNEIFDITPTFNELVHSEYSPKTNIDYDKMFGKDWDKNYNDISVNKIKYEADKVGKDWKTLAHDMANEATKRERYRIAHGEDEGGWFDSPKSFTRNLIGGLQNTFTPRVQESIARGEEPTTTDYALDIGQDVLETVPWGRVAGIAGAGGKALAPTLARYAASNVTAPLVSEIGDAALYDDTERGEFSPSDVIGGTMVNATVPGMANLLGRGLSRMGFTQEAGKAIKEFGSLQDGAKTREQINKTIRTGQLKQAQAKRLNTRFNKGENLTKSQLEIASQYNPDTHKERQELLAKIRKGKYSPEDVAKIIKDPELYELWANKAKTRNTLLGEETVKNLITNKIGGYSDVQKQAITRVPVIGRWYYNKQLEAEKEAEEAKKQQEILDEFKYRKLLLGEN